MATKEGEEHSSEGNPPPGAPASVFISYASQDRDIAKAVVEDLEQHGIKCWIAPRDVSPGSQYAHEIVGAINEATIAILVLSENAIGSPHVGREIERAASKRRGIIVLRTDAAPLTRSFEYFLSESQWIDVAALGTSAALTKLTQAVLQRLSPSSWVSSGLGTDVRDPSDHGRRLSYLAIKRIVAAAAFLVLAAVVIGVLVRYWPSRQGAAHAPVVTAIPDNSIAVLPFLDLSEKKDQEYFADGMAEEIIDLLVKIPALKVISRTSSFQFKGQTQDLRNIGTKLNVSYVLQGSVRKSGDRLRVSAQLINSKDETNVWSQTYERQLNDVLKMQDEMAANVARALQIQVGADEIISRPTLQNPEAYTLYLQGRHGFDRLDRQGLEQAARFYRRALDLDPSFAAAEGELAKAYFFLAMNLFMPLTSAIEQSRSAAERALVLAPNNASAHAALGNIHQAYDWDWSAADLEFSRARGLAPNDAYVLFASGMHAYIMGRSDEALKIANTCMEHSPLDSLCYSLLSHIQASLGQWADAETAARRVLEISPTSSLGYTTIGDLLLARNQPEAALAEYLKEPSDTARLRGSSMSYFLLGRRKDSDAALAALERLPNVSFFIAEVAAYRGESDEAFKWLDRAYAEKHPQLAFVKLQSTLKNLQNNPRYKEFLRKMNLPE